MQNSLEYLWDLNHCSHSQNLCLLCGDSKEELCAQQEGFVTLGQGSQTGEKKLPGFPAWRFQLPE